MKELSGLTIRELRELSNQVRIRLEEAEREEIASARRQIEEIAKSVGVPIKDLLGSKAKEKKSAPVQFRHPDDPTKEWSGRGRQKNWVREWLQSGKSLDALRINS